MASFCSTTCSRAAGWARRRVEGDYVRAIDALNHKLASDPRVEAVLLSVADGIQFCRKR